MKDQFLFDVFLSHSSKDKAVVRPLAEKLRADGLRVWFDEWVIKPGDSIPGKIDEGLEQSRVLVLCMSAHAFGSDWAQLEAGTYRFQDPLNRKRRFIPLRLDDAPIKGSLKQLLCINWKPVNQDREYAKLLASIQEVADSSPPDQGYNTKSFLSPYRSLLEDRLRDFTGRDYIFEAINHFVASNECGYFILQGDPGMGKTTVLAEIARRNNLVAHFNIRALGTAGVMPFQQSTIEQLGHRLRPEPCPTPTLDSATDSQIVIELMQLAASQTASPLILVIDALDEIDPLEYKNGQNILMLPPELPPDVFCVLSCRNINVPLRSTAPQKELVMEEHDLFNMSDAKNYVSKRLKSLEKLLPSKTNKEKLASELTEASSGNFMYLRFIIDEIGQGDWKLERMKTLPAGLKGYYQDHWRRMGMDKTPPPEERLRIVYVLAELVGQASMNMISKLSDCSVLQVQSVLQDWSQFIRKEGHGKSARYSIYHASFRDFLIQQEVVTAAEISLQELREQMGRFAYKQIFSDE